MRSLKAETLKAWVYMSLTAALVFPAGVGADPGTLADSPLFVGTSVKPNVMTLFDDSGSMNWSILLSKDVVGPNRSFLQNNFRTAYSGTEIFDPTPDGTFEWRELCSAFNVMAYNPNINYTPWFGVDANGAQFTTQSAGSARIYPTFPGMGTVNLTSDECDRTDLENLDPSGCASGGSGFVYVQWNDADGDGEWDLDECLPSSEGGQASKVWVSGLSGQQRKNYANWFSYYRKREFVAKRAFTELAATSNVRMGLATLHDNDWGGDTVGEPVADLTKGSNRDELLESLVNIFGNSGTPLRWKLAETGFYFDKDDGNGLHENLGDDFNGTTSPILDSANGGQCQQNFTMLMTDGFWNGSDPGAGNLDGDDDTAFDGGSHADGVSDTLADIAMFFYEDDLASGLADAVPTGDVDKQDAQHMVTFGIAFGVNGNLGSMPPNRDDPFSGWPDPLVEDSQDTIDDLRHAAWNSRGEFLNAQDPDGLVKGMREALSEITSRASTASGASFSSVELTSDTKAFLGQFDADGWSGDLLAFPIDLQDGTVEQNPTWRAADELDNTSAANRDIFTFNGGGVPFQWNDLTSAQQADLKTGPGGTTQSDAAGKARLQYIRGKRTHENQGTPFDFRQRDSRLGDIVNSAPVVRNDTVFVGANDGMLHALNTQTGEERFAYIPSAVYSSNTEEGLHYLTDPSYSHDFYVDGGPAITPRRFSRQESTFVDDGDSSDDEAVLVGGLRKGGRGLYALNVTNPSQFDGSQVLWEFTAADDADLGFTYSKPVIAQVESRNWVVIVGNGYNNTGTGEAVLYVLDLQDGSVIEKISTGRGSLSNKNGLSSVQVADTDGNGLVDRAYAGDVQGNLWAFELEVTSGSGNNVQRQYDVAYGTTNQPQPLFSGKTDEPITAAPTVAKHPLIRDSGQNQPNMMVSFGTGQFVADGDKTSNNDQFMYGVWDHGQGGLSQNDLKQQTFDKQTSEIRVLGDATVPYLDSGSAQRDGWYFELPADRERVIDQAFIRNGVVFFTSLIPTAGAVCSGATGGWFMATTLAMGGQPTDPVFDFNDDGVIDQDDTDDGSPLSGYKIDGNTAGGSSTIGNTAATGTTRDNGNITVDSTRIWGSAKPLSWEELQRD